MYGLFNFAGAALVVFLTFMWVLIGLFCCMLTHCCGFQVKKKSHFSKRTRFICENTCLGLFILFMFLFVILGYAAGTQKLFDFVTAMQEAPKGGMEFYTTELINTLDLLVGTTSAVAVPFIYSANYTLHEGVSLNIIYDDLVILNESFSAFPDTQVMREYIDEVVNITNSMGYTIDDIVYEIEVLGGVVDNVSYAAIALDMDLETLGELTTNISAAIGDAVQALDNITATNDLLFGEGTSDNIGLIPQTEAELLTISRNDELTMGFPSEGRFQSAGSTQDDQLMTGNFNFNAMPNELAEYNRNLSDIYLAIAVLPDYSVTADNLRLINDTVNVVTEDGGLVDTVVNSLTELDSLLDEIEDSSYYTSQVENLYSAVEPLNLEAMYDNIEILAGLVDRIPPQLDLLSDEVQKYADIIPDVVPVLYDLLVTQLIPFNETLFKLPDNTSEQFYTINATLYDGIKTANDLVKTLNDSKTSINSINITAYLVTLQQAQDSLDSNINSFNFSGLTSSLEDMTSSLNISFQEYIDQLTTLKTDYTNAKMDASFVDSVDQFQGVRAYLENAFQRIISPIGFSNSTWDTPATQEGDYLLMEKGVCTNDNSVYCSDDGECSPGTCVEKGTYRCSSNGNTVQPRLDCSYDADCVGEGGGSYCLVDLERGANFSALLNIWAQDGGVDFPDTSSLVDDLEALLDAQYDTTEVNDQLAQSQDDTTILDTDEYSSSVQDLIDGLDAFDLNSINSTLFDTKKTLDTVDTGSFNETLSDIENEQNKLLKSVGVILDFLDAFMDFLYKPERLDFYLKALLINPIQEVRDTQGTGPTVDYIAAVVDQMYSDINDVMDMLESEIKINLPKMNASKELADYATYLNRAEANPFIPKFDDMDEHGSFYWMMQQDGAYAKMVTASDDPLNKNGYVLYDEDGDSYEDENGDTIYCVTDVCWDNTEATLTEDNFNLAGTELPTSLQNLLGLAWLCLAVVFLLAIAALLCPLCTKKQSSCSRQCPATCMIIIMIMCLPWYFFLNGLLFPMAIFLSDGCTTGTNVINEYVDAVGDDWCVNSLGGEGTSNACRLKSNKFDVTINIDKMVEGFLGECSGSDPFQDALTQLYDQIEAGTISEAVDNQLTGKSTFKDMREPVRDIIRDAAAAMDGVALNYLDNVVESFDCDAVAAMLSDIKKPVCNDFAGSFGWFTGMVYLASWLMFCVGIPAGCCVQHNAKWTRIEDENAAEEEDSDEEDSDNEDESDKGDNRKDVEAGGKSGDVLFVPVATSEAQGAPRERSESDEKRKEARRFLRHNDPHNPDLESSDDEDGDNHHASAGARASAPPQPMSNPAYEPLGASEEDGGDVQLVGHAAAQRDPRSVAPLEQNLYMAVGDDTSAMEKAENSGAPEYLNASQAP